MKDKPNSQGTLFGVNPSQRTPESRQPRGFSPQRYGDVMKAIDVQRKDRGPGNYGGHQHGGRSYTVYGGHAEQLARTVNAVARSTIPLSHMTQPHPDQPASDDNPTLHVGVWNHTVEEEGEQGHYSRSGSTAMKNQARIAIMQGASDETPIHEIGHHRDAMTRGLHYSTPREQGTAEGFADAYAQEHGRTAGYKKKRTEVKAYPRSWKAALGHDDYETTNFADSYKKQHTPLNEKQFDPQAPPPGQEKTYPSHHVPGQQALLHKVYAREGKTNWETGEKEKLPSSWRYNEDVIK